MGNPPVSVNDFLTEVRRLEIIVDSVAGPVKEVTEKEDVKKTTQSPLESQTAGKRVSRPLGAESAINTVQAPTTSSSGSPIIEVDIFRVGTQRAMVDTGARQSVIRADLLQGQSCFNIQSPLQNWRSLDGNKLAVVGETSLVVRFSGVTIDLTQVLEMENAAHPVVLGMDWIGKAEAVIYVENEKPVVNYVVSINNFRNLQTHKPKWKWLLEGCKISICNIKWYI